METEEGLRRFLASFGLILSSFPDKGRALIATKDFSPGDVIISQAPYASTPNNFSSAPACDGCFATTNLKRCSSCKIAWYCGSTCQKSEWKLHQSECAVLKALSDDRRKMLTPTIRLMVRLLLKKMLQSKKALPTTPSDNYDLVRALISHISDIDEKQLVLYAQMANLVNLVIPSQDVSIKEVTENFSRLACNAHTICDNELRPLGTGIYPIISKVNHSCLPNAVLVFDKCIAVVRAVEHIANGTEILISYIETAATTSKRRRDLKDQYFFTCECLRCNPIDPMEDAKLEGFRCSDVNCDGPAIHEHGKKVCTCHKCGLSWDHVRLDKALREEKQLSEICHQFLSECNYLKSKTFLKMLEECQYKLFHPFSLNLLRTKENIMKASMELKDWDEALSYCRLTIPSYQRVYSDNHVMVGLQYYTCGKLEWFLGQAQSALASLTKAMDVLRISYGTSVPFMRDLLSKLEEVRAEAAYGHRVNEDRDSES